MQDKLNEIHAMLKNISGQTYDVNKQSKAAAITRSGGQAPTPEIDIKSLPYNHYTPAWARTFEFKKLTEVPANAGKLLLFEFKVPSGMTLVWTHYALFNDAFTTASYFDITVNNAKVLKFHGDPADDFKLSLGNNASLDESALNEANIIVREGETIRWFVINDDDVKVTMGVRMKGFIDNSSKIKSHRFGG
jgi:hypothetical protein